MIESKLFLLDIGNTHSKSCLYDGEIFFNCCNFSTEDLETFNLPKDIPVVIASVVPKWNNKIQGKNVFWIHYKLKTGIDLSLVDAAKLGVDRLANLVALSKTVALPAMVIDCGTAITLEVLSKDRVFYGGPIAPGRQLMRKSLNSYTAQLPFIPVENKLQAKTFGYNTEDAIIMGTDLGIIGAVKEYIAKTKDLFKDRDCRVYITGGDAEILLKNIPNTIALDPLFTLKGIAFIWEMNNESRRTKIPFRAGSN